MTVGESLTEARHQAGLSVDELSERTRIRETVIRSIERDDYDACGGELYVRGYVRALAGAVGIDAQPLIREYDQVREDPDGAYGAGVDSTRFDLKPIPGDAEATRFDLPAVSDDPTAGEDLMAAGYDLPSEGTAVPAEPAVAVAKHARPPRPPVAASEEAPRRRRGRGALAGVAALVVLAVAGLIAVHLSSSSPTARNAAVTSTPPKTSAAAKASAAAAKAAAARAAAARAAAARAAAAKAKAAQAKAAKAKAAHRSLPVTALPVAAAEAFGPDGVADGDNPGNARYAISGDAPLPWTTQWYATSSFGMLKHGTGLLLDLGQRVTITSVRLDLSQYGGADLQLRAGNGTSPGDLPAVATVTGADGVLRLTLRHPASARYLLVWFTQLPPNGSGQYEESVSRVLVNGRR